MGKRRSYPRSFPVRCQCRGSKLPPEGAVLEGGEERVERCAGCCVWLVLQCFISTSGGVVGAGLARDLSYNQTAFHSG